MSSKIDLDFSVDAKLELRWQDEGTLDLQITDEDDVIQSLTGNTITMDIFKKGYDIVQSITAELNDEEDKAIFTIDADFWTSLELTATYYFRIRRETDEDLKTIVNGDVIIN